MRPVDARLAPTGAERRLGDVPPTSILEPVCYKCPACQVCMQKVHVHIIKLKLYAKMRKKLCIYEIKYVNTKKYLQTTDSCDKIIRSRRSLLT